MVVVLPRTYSQTLSHTAAISRASHPAARSNTLEKTKENTVLVVALPRTYSLSVTSTLSHFSTASHPAARSNTLEKTKENTVLVVVLSRTYSPASDKHSLTLLPTGNTELLLFLPRAKTNKTAVCFIGSLAPWLKPCDISNAPMLQPPTTLKSLLPTAGQPSGTLQSSASTPLTWASSLGKAKHFFCPLQHSRLAVLHPVAPANIGPVPSSQALLSSLPVLYADPPC